MDVRRARWRVERLIVVVPLVLVACGSPDPGYLVTSEPLPLTPQGLCLVVEPANDTGLWWFGAGRNGCADRSTDGPDWPAGLISADGARVGPVQPDGSRELSFRVRFIVPIQGGESARDFAFVLGGDGVLTSADGERVAMNPLSSLEIPFTYGG